MFSEKDLVARSKEEMLAEVKDLLEESLHLKAEHEAARQKEEELRRESIEKRAVDPVLAETLWQEAEQLREDGREMLRRSLEMKLRAGEVQHRIDIHDQIGSMDNYDEVWRKAVKAGRG